MKKILSIVLVLSIVAQGMVNLGLCAYYQLNKKMIAEKLCVNKNKPQMHCDGKCFLSKQLKKAEENEKRQSQSLNQKDEVVTSEAGKTTIFFAPSYRFISFLGIFDDLQLSSPHTVLEQPPAFSA